MSSAPSSSAPAKPPGQPGGTSAPEGVACVLVLLQWIVAFGKDLADTFHQRTANADFHAFVTNRFHTSDLDAIFARIRRGLMLALALQARLTRRAATGRDIPEAKVRFYPPRGKRSGSADKPAKPRRTNIIDLPLDRLPTAEQIAEELRRRPVGAVLVDICRDLGILPGNLTGAQWRDLSDTIVRFGGNMVVLLFKESTDRLRQLAPEAFRRRKSARAESRSTGSEAAYPTGPPPLAQAA